MTTGEVADVLEVRRGAYHDSVTLMQVSRDVAGGRRGVGRPGRDGHRAQPRPAARHGLRAAGRRRAERPGGRGARRGRRRRATGRSPRWSRPSPRPRPASAGGDGLGGDGPAPRTVASAARRTGGADLALVSVPGPHAFTEAMDALGAGPVGAGLQRQRAGRGRRCGSRTRPRARGLLVMGPDCGTAVVGGVGLGFANAVRPGPVGLVAASGTGAQQLMCMLDTRERRRQPLPRRRRPRPVRGRRRPLDPRGAGAARRRPGHRADRAGVQAARPRRRGRDHGVRRVAGHAGAARPARAGRRQASDLTDVARQAVEAVGGTLGRAVVRGTASRRRRRAARCAGCSPAARSATRRC